VVVHPSEQQLLLGQLEQILLGLTIPQQQDKARMMRQVDLTKQTDLDDLPEQTQDQVLLGLIDIVGPNVNDVTADRLGRPQRQLQVL